MRRSPDFWTRQLHRAITLAVHVREAQDSCADILSAAAPCRVLSTSWTLAVFCVSTHLLSISRRNLQDAARRLMKEHGLTCREVEDSWTSNTLMVAVRSANVFLHAPWTQLTLYLLSFLDKAKASAWSASRTQPYRITWPLNQLKITE
jgi:hypothetical protein